MQRVLISVVIVTAVLIAFGMDGLLKRTGSIEAFAQPGMGGAVVHNPGEGKPDGFCFFGPFDADTHTAVRTPTSGGILNCHFSDLPRVDKTERVEGFTCFLSLNGLSFTNDTSFVHTPPGKGRMTCKFHHVPESPVQSCESRYSPDLICEVGPRSCRFYVVLGGSTCADYCESRGGRCLDAASDADNGCEVEEQRSCDDSAIDQICECSL